MILSFMPGRQLLGLCFSFVTLIVQYSFGQTVTAKFDGNWATNTNWDTGAKPVETNSVRVGKTMLVDQNISITSGNFTFGFNGIVATGTISCTAGNATVTGSGTSFSVDLAVGQFLQTATGAVVGQIESITNNTSLTLKDLDPGSSTRYATQSLANSSFLKNSTSDTNITDVAGGTTYTLSMSNNSPSPSQNTLVIKSGTTLFEGAATFKNANLYIEPGATLIVGSMTMDNQGFCYIYVASGGTLLVNGNLQNDNNGGLFVIEGSVQVNGNYSSSNGNVAVTGQGTLESTGTMTTSGSSTIFNSTNNCTTGPCSGDALQCGNNGTAYTSSVTPVNTVICDGGTRAALTFNSNASASPGLAIQGWEVSTTNSGSGYSTIPGTMGMSTYPSSGSLSSTSWYRVVYTISNCSATALFSPPAQVYVVKAINSTPNQTICTTQSIVLAGNATTSGVTGLWTVTGGTGTFSNANTPTSSFTPSAAGTYSLVWSLSSTTPSCSSSSGATILTVTASPVASAGILANPGTTICNGTSVTFTATPTNGGTSPTYQWQSSPDGTTWTNISGATSVSYTSSSLPNNVRIRVQMTSSLSCVAAGTVNSADLTMSVNGTTANSWTGATSNDWSVGSNWFCGTVPTAAIDLTLTSGVTNYPLLNTSAQLNNLTIASGASFNFDNSGALTITGNLLNNGTFNAAKLGTVSFSGTTATISGSGSTDFNNVGVTGTVALNSTANLYGTLNITNGQFNAGGSSSAVWLTLKSTSISQHGSIGSLPSEFSFTGFIAAERYMDALNGTFRYISAPVTSSPAKPASIYKLYDYVNNNWIGAGNLAPGKGYAALIYNASPITWTVIGQTNTTTQTINFAADGWYLIGNPYPADIQWKNPISNPTSWTMNNVSSTMAVTDNHLNGPNYYRYYDYTGTLPTWTSTGSTLSSGLIAMGQAFWVYAGAGGSITIGQGAKSSGATFYRESTESEQGLSIIVSNEMDMDQAFLKVAAKSTEGYEKGKDLPKLWNERLNVYFIDQSKGGLLINSLGSLHESIEMPLGVKAEKPGTYTLSFGNTENFQSAADLYLVDKVKSIYVPVNKDTRYTFDIARGGVAVDDRFYLTMRSTPINALPVEVQILTYPNPVKGKLFVEMGTDQPASLWLMDMNGKRMTEAEITGNTTVDMTTFPAGMYLLKVQTRQGVTTHKIMKTE